MRMPNLSVRLERPNSPCRAIMYCPRLSNFMKADTVEESTSISLMNLWVMFNGVMGSLSASLCRRNDLLLSCDLLKPRLSGRRDGLPARRRQTERLRGLRERRLYCRFGCLSRGRAPAEADDGSGACNRLLSL